MFETQDEDGKMRLGFGYIQEISGRRAVLDVENADGEAVTKDRYRDVRVVLPGNRPGRRERQ